MTQAPDVLLVEDNPGDIELLREAFLECGVDARFHVFQDVGEACGFLAKRDGNRGAPTPALVISDLCLPRADGRDLLTFAKGHSLTAHIPVLILTSSSRKLDQEQCQQLGADAYFVKPHCWQDYLDLTRQLAEWLPSPAAS